MKRRHPSNPFHSLVVLLLFVVTALVAVHRPSSTSRSIDETSVQGEYGNILVIQVYDGDTVKLNNGEKVRFIGIDTPESKENKKLFRDAQRSGQDVRTILRMGRIAGEYTKSLLNGRRVRLEFDIERRDKYGRLLAYIYRLDDGLFVNEDIIRNGYAYPMAIPPNIRYADEFRKFFAEARKNHRGLWGKSFDGGAQVDGDR